MDALSANVGQDLSETVCGSLLSSADDSRCDRSGSSPAQGRARAGSDDSLVLSAGARALTFRVPVRFAGVSLLVHTCGTGNLLARSDGRASGGGVSPGIQASDCMSKRETTVELQRQLLLSDLQ